MNLPLIVALIAFVFIISYSPKRKKELYQSQPSPVQVVPQCDEARYQAIQGLTPVCYGGHPREIAGAIYAS